MRIKWTDRRFNFDFPAGIYPEMIERIRGTPARLEDLFAGLPSETLTAQVERPLVHAGECGPPARSRESRLATN